MKFVIFSLLLFIVVLFYNVFYSLIKQKNIFRKINKILKYEFPSEVIFVLKRNTFIKDDMIPDIIKGLKVFYILNLFRKNKEYKVYKNFGFGMPSVLFTMIKNID